MFDNSNMTLFVFLTLAQLWLFISLPVLAVELEWVDTINAGNWLDKMKLQNGYSDEPGEYVRYINYTNAVLKNLVRSDRDSFMMKVDDNSMLSPNAPGRDSISIRSRHSYGPGAIMLDIEHIPESGCGARPRAFLADNDNREIVPLDMYSHQNHMGMQTTSNCTGANTFGCNSNKFQACYVRFGSVADPATDYLNDIEGIVMTVQWREDEVNMWISGRREFQRLAPNGAEDSSRAPILGESFDTRLLKAPWVSFNRSASLCGEYRTPIYPKEMKIGIETTFCGDEQEETFIESTSCTANFRSCREAVATSPGAFSRTFWRIRSISVYRERSNSYYQ